MYTIHLDKTTDFECKIKIQGASIKKTKVNLVLESDDYSLKFKGVIDADGRISVPLAKLKGVLDEDKKGNLYLEVIADDTYFTPYETQYITEVSRKVEVVSVNGRNKQNLIENVDDSIPSKKPQISIIEVTHDTKSLILEHTKNIVKTLRDKKLNIFNSADSKELITTIKSYLNEHKIDPVLNKDIMTNLYNIISRIK